jgi:hypothetical protein
MVESSYAPQNTFLCSGVHPEWSCSFGSLPRPRPPSAPPPPAARCAPQLDGSYVGGRAPPRAGGGHTSRCGGGTRWRRYVPRWPRGAAASRRASRAASATRRTRAATRACAGGLAARRSASRYSLRAPLVARARGGGSLAAAGGRRSGLARPVEGGRARLWSVSSVRLSTASTSAPCPAPRQTPRPAGTPPGRWSGAWTPLAPIPQK